MVFGIIEWSSAYHDSSVTADASRAGGRIASAQARNPDYATNAAAAVAAALSTLPSDAPQEMWVYKANSNGYPLSGGFTSCTTSCIKYTWNSGTKQFNTATPQGGGWIASTQQVCAEPFDQIGIYVKMRHDFVTHFFGASITLEDHSVFRFEPTPSAACSST